ncbi:MAG TPA: peptidoglycan-associated lipoprotein Pal [Geminicoccaceae bacterium]|jgi:peptidoglycan-associated lipoprotein|nr:peptidoglycan-associated lipoprotein Pal [Geminicoccaceae bacterium]
MISTPLRLSAALLLLAACTSADEGPQSGLEGGAEGVSGGRPGVASSELAGQPTPGTQEDLAVSVGDRVFFEYDSAVLTSEATGVLDQQAAWLKQYPDVIVTIEGHTDERGAREYNLALGDRRANAVKNYLVALGISPQRILTISYGEERPAEPGHDETAWARNRRAVTVVAVTG